MCECNMCLFSVVLVLSVVCVTSYNVDTFNFAAHRGQSHSMFGFSVATHKERGTSWVLIGAPEAQSRIQQVDRGGAVFKCRTDTDTDERAGCDEIPFDTHGDNVGPQGGAIDQKSHQWFGATVHSAGEDKPVVACAPRYVWFTHKRERRDPVGTCYVADNSFTQVEEYSPCRTGRWGYHRQGSCQAGLGAAISKDGRRLFIGAPGSWYWQGQMYSIDAHARFPFVPPRLADKPYGSGQVIQQSLETRPAVLFTSEGRAADDDSYMGYSVAVGDFTGAGIQGVAVGMPKGDQLFGKVLLFTWNLTNQQNITGRQIGAYFGYAVASSDIDGDKRDDLIIGAPMHTEPNNEGRYEVGRIYIMYQGSGSEERFRRTHVIDGFKSKSRFGLSLASLGDINLDGYGDFAVGAPYDGPHERGAVYIYHGSKHGYREKYSQVIYAEDISQAGLPNIQTFGFSVSGGLDLDGNDYPDMVVGAYLSDSAFFFRSRPVVVVDSTVKFLTPRKEIVLEEKQCHHNNQKVACSKIEFCVRYVGIGVPQSLNLHLQYILDSKKIKDKRMFLMQQNRATLNETIYLHKGDKHQCRIKDVYIMNEIKDKLTALEVEVKYFLEEETRSFTYTQRDPRSVLKPVLDLNTPPSSKDSISVHKNCGSDDICVPDLNLAVTPNVDKYLLDSGNELVLDVLITNNGEDAFESSFWIVFPPGVNFKKVTEEKTQVRISCSNVLGTNNTLQCEIGNPLPEYQIANFKIHLQPYHLEGMAASYEFDMHVNSTNPEGETTTANNQMHLSVGIWIDSTLELHGNSHPEEIHYNMSQYATDKVEVEHKIGPQVIHLYTIKNKGPATINEAEIFFIWPYATLDGDDLLYLLEQPHTTGNIQCEPAIVNEKNYLLDTRKKTVWEIVNIDSSQEHSSQPYLGGKKAVAIEEGQGIVGGVGKEEKKETTQTTYKNVDSGDSSSFNQQRHNTSQSYQGGSRVYITEDQGHGSNVIKTGGGVSTVKTISRYNTTFVNGQPVGRVYENTTIIRGPDGRIIDQKVVTGTSKDFSQYGRSGVQQGSHTSSSSRDQFATRTNYNLHSSPSIIYSSSGHNPPQAQAGESHHGSSAASATSGQDFSISGENYTSADGSTPVVNQPYPGHVHSASTGRHFGWNGGQSNTEYSQGQGGYQNQYDRSYHRGGHDVYVGNDERKSYEQEGRMQSGYDQGGSVQSGYEQRGSSQSGYEQRGSSQSGYEQRGSSQSGYEQRGSSQSGYEQGGSSQSGYEQGGSRQSGFQQGGSGQSGYERGGSRQSGYEQRGGGQIGYEQGESGQSGYQQGESRGGSRQSGYNYSWNTQSQSQSGERHGSSYGSADFQGQSGIGAAAYGQGFRTTTLDLGTLGNVNIEEGVVDNRQEPPSSRVYDPDLGIWVDRNQRGQTHRTYSSSEQHESSYRRGHRDHSAADNVPRDNVATDRPDPNRKFVGRRKREALDESDLKIEEIKNCKNTLCRTIRCTVGPMGKDDEPVLIAFRARVDVHTLRNISTSKSISFSSMMLARINKLPYIGTPVGRVLHSHEVFTTVSAPEPDIKPGTVPLWVVILSAVAGAIILLLLIFMLYKCGFFKRNRPTDSAERQPLNRNGYHHGDEAL